MTSGDLADVKLVLWGGVLVVSLVSVSKTHLLMHPEGNRLFVEDRQSVNGTTVEGEDGTITELVPGRSVEILSGSMVYVGDRTMSVHRRDASGGAF